MGETLAIWRIALAGAATAHIEIPTMFDRRETERARRLVFARDRVRFVRAHLGMRVLLGQALGVAPGEVSFTHGPQGKPAVDGFPGLHFNLSHAGDWALLAIASSPVGVDIEEMGQTFALDGVARQVFSPAELEQFRALPPQARRPAFWKGWTSKEAYIKALGLGFSLPPREFTVCLNPDLGPRLVEAWPYAPPGPRWRLSAIVGAPPGYHATLATGAAGLPSVSVNEWRPDIPQ